MGTQYYHRTTEVVPVAIDDLRDFKHASFEEFWQFSFGGFLASGSFWLGVERFFTIKDWSTDLLFWICVVALASGIFIGFFGLRQLRRRATRIDYIIKTAEKITLPGPTVASTLEGDAKGTVKLV